MLITSGTSGPSSRIAFKSNSSELDARCNSALQISSKLALLNASFAPFIRKTSASWRNVRSTLVSSSLNERVPSRSELLRGVPSTFGEEVRSKTSDTPGSVVLCLIRRSLTNFVTDASSFVSFLIATCVPEASSRVQTDSVRSDWSCHLSVLTKNPSPKLETVLTSPKSRNECLLKDFQRWSHKCHPRL